MSPHRKLLVVTTMVSRINRAARDEKAILHLCIRIHPEDYADIVKEIGPDPKILNVPIVEFGGAPKL